MVVPPLSTLLTNPSWEVLSDVSPLLRALLSHKSEHERVLLFAPWPLDKLWVEHFLPPVKALNISPPLEAHGDSLPVAAFVLFDSIGQQLVLLPSPVALVGSILVLCGPRLVDRRILKLSLTDYG